MTKRLVLLVSAWLVLGCAGRDPDPVPAYIAGDRELSCEEIRVEQAAIEAEVARLTHDANKRGKNIALGAAGIVTLGVAWLWMDFSDAEEVEIEAYRERFLSLEDIAKSKSCGDSPLEGADRGHITATVEERLEKLDELREEGHISESEYERLRQHILDDL